MSTTVLPDAGVIEHLDFTPALPCEADEDETCEYGNTADYIVKSLPCPACDDPHGDRYPCCHTCWVDMTQRGALVCADCGYVDGSGQAVRIVEVLR